MTIKKLENMNNSSNKVRKNQVKLFTSLFDIFAPKQFQDVYHLRSQENKKHQTVFKAPCDNKDSNNLNTNENNFSEETPYITSENYHSLNNKFSNKSIIRSTSTLFYDLDKLIKRHSYHCITQLNMDRTVNISDKSNRTCFGAISETIVQKCAAQVQPKLKPKDHFLIDDKKVKKSRLKDPILSSEICLHDNKDGSYNPNLKHKDRRQKFWSYAKYETEYINPIPKEKKRKKKDRGKRIEDPCPCQLFSYACPCTNKKSLTELAKNSKCLTVADQITSTTKFIPEEVKENRYSKSKNSKCETHENKLMNTDNSKPTIKYEMSPVSKEAVSQIISPRLVQKEEDSFITNNDSKIKRKSYKKIKKVFCPKCKEKIEILSTTEEEVSYVKVQNSPINQETVYNENLSYKEDNDICNHNPPCELIPICQILPNDNYVTSKHVANMSTVKHNAKMIRITKACRHHPPCTVVPSCQRINVLNNNCEFIPPCLHQPRCINLPLCVPFSKNFYYDEISNKQTEEVDITNCPQYKYTSAYDKESINNYSNIDRQFHATKNTCEYFSDYSPRLILNPKMASVSPTFSPYMPHPMSCKCCMANKSCQYDCIDCKCAPQNDTKEKSSDDSIIYIRDVGCQFRNKSFSPQDSLLYSKTSSTSFNINSIKKTGKYSNEFHTLRCEDKCTNPISGEELSMSTFTTSSLEIDVHCPSHGRHTNRGHTDFCPKPTVAPFVAAFTTYTNQLLPNYLSISEEITQEPKKSRKVNNSIHTRIMAHPTKFRTNFLKGKRKKVCTTKRQRKTKLESKSRLGWQSSS